MMRRWLPYAAIGAFYIGLVILVLVWIRPLFVRRDGPRESAQLVYSSLYDRVMFENNELRRAVLRDSLQRVVPTDRRRFVEAGDSASGYLMRLLDRELGNARAATVGVIEVSARFGTHPGVNDLFAGRMSVTGQRDGVPYCVIVLPGPFDRTARFIAQEAVWGGLFGTCHWFARYGAPGPYMQQWLDAGGARHFARFKDPQNNTWAGFLRGLEVPPNYESLMRRRMPIRGQKCLSGQKEACAEAVASFEMIGEERAQYLAFNMPRLVMGEGSMFAQLEADFGQERFRRFWKSDRPFQEAFEQSFGVSLGEWVYDWTEPLGHMRAGARLSLSSIILTFLLIGALVGGALLTAQNRRI
jgi:hypothetical protein